MEGDAIRVINAVLDERRTAVEFEFRGAGKSTPLFIRASEPVLQAGAEAFFSGGVDSFYTFLKHRHEITDLAVVHGFDSHNHEAAEGTK